MAEYDVIVIGCGPAGQKAAIKCAKVGRRVAVVDDRQVVGGQCLHIGTIPSKALRASIFHLSGYRERRIYGSDYRVKQQITAEDLVYRCNAVIRREIEVIHDQLARNKVDVRTGTARFVDPHRVRVTSIVGTGDITAEHTVIATGSSSHIEQQLPFDNVHILNTDDILNLQFIPQRMVLVGGGVIGLEYASMFSLLDMDVHLVTRRKQLLPWVDRQLVGALESHMKRQGVRLQLETHVTEVQVAGRRKVVGQLSNGDEFTAEMLLHAAPRWGNTADLNLDAAGIKTCNKGYLSVNEHYQTEVPFIYAAGDVIGFPSLASTAIDQGRKAANHLLGMADVPYDPILPYGIYTFPDISMAGASEDQLKQEGRSYEVGVGHYRDSARGQIIGDTDGLIKLLFDPDTRQLLGVHIIGSQATELVHLGQAVMIAGEKIDYFLDTVFNYPTLTEVYKIAALNGFNKLDVSRPMKHL